MFVNNKNEYPYSGYMVPTIKEPVYSDGLIDVFELLNDPINEEFIGGNDELYVGAIPKDNGFVVGIFRNYHNMKDAVREAITEDCDVFDLSTELFLDFETNNDEIDKQVERICKTFLL